MEGCSTDWVTEHSVVVGFTHI